MATHDYVIDNSTGANVRADINNVLQAILTNNSSSSAPSTTAAYMFWADTTSGTLKIRNSSDNAWVELLQLDGTLTLEDGSASTPGLAFRDDLNTGIFSSAADTFNVATAGVERLELGTETIFNEDGADVDFRIESDANPNMFKLDAGNSRVGIGLSTPTSILHIKPNVAGGDCQVHIEAESGNDAVLLLDSSTGGGANADVRFAADGTTKGRISFFNASSAGDMAFAVGSNAEAMRIDSSGRVLIGTTSSRNVGGSTTNSIFQIEGASQNASSISLTSHKNDATGAFVFFGKTRGGSSGSATIVQDGDTLGGLSFIGADSVDTNNRSAEITAKVNGTPANNTIPTDLVFSTSTANANQLAEAMRITSDGTVQIAAGGAIAGFASSHITGSVAPLKIYKSSSTSHAVLQLIWDHFNTSTSINQKIQFTIGDDASSDGFNNAGFIGIEKIDSWQSGAGRSSALIFGTTASATEAEGFRLDNNGRVLIGRTSTASSDTAFKLQVFAPSDGAMGIGSTNTSSSGTATFNFMPSNSVTGAQIICQAEEDFSTSANRTARLEFKTRLNGTLATKLFIHSNGDINAQGVYDSTTSSGANVNVHTDGHLRRSTSSRKYKNTITDATHGLTELLKLKSVTFKGNDDGDTVFGGLIAEDVHDAGLTEFVHYDKDNEPDALAYGNMVALCVKAIQELTARVATLEAA
tara:strand:+ start:3 stop:2093 length:2091 start_codon:yes stop_codon:yes gene_type:complete